MKLSKFKSYLKEVKAIKILLPNGTLVPEHFHITEIGLINKDFIDCGGTVRNEKVANFQLWEANDFDHRLAPEKLLSIIAQSEKVIGQEDLDVEVEYQGDTIGKYGIAYDGEQFILTPKHTACLANDSCGIPPEKQKLPLSEIADQESCCAPGGGCC